VLIRDTMVIFAFVIGLLPAGAFAQQATSAGQIAYVRNCANCHANPGAIGAPATGLDDPARRTALDQFLTRHHAADPASRAAVVSWLAEVTR